MINAQYTNHLTDTAPCESPTDSSALSVTTHHYSKWRPQSNVASGAATTNRAEATSGAAASPVAMLASQETPPSLLLPPRSTLPWPPPSMPRPPIGIIALSGVASVNVAPGGIMVPVGIAGVASGIGVVVVVVIVPGTVAGVAPGLVVDFWLRSCHGYIQDQRIRSEVHVLSSTDKSILHANGKYY